MVTDQFRKQAASFGSVADVYERSRPSYPANAVEWLAGDRPTTALDLAAGTGKLTRALVAAGHNVVAVDPSEPMLAQLRLALPDIDARIGTAESVPLADASVEVVTVAQAFHWFDPKTALPEIARVLVPGGRLALVWNMADKSTPWVDELWQIINPGEPEDVEPPVFTEPFASTESQVFEHSQQLTRSSLLDLVASRSYVAILPPDEQAAILSEVGGIYDHHAGRDGLVLPYQTCCFCTRLLDAS